MLQYLTPMTLEEMYNDLDEARLLILNSTDSDNMINNAEEYRKLTNLISEIDKQYNAITGEDLWIKAAIANA